MSGPITFFTAQTTKEIIGNSGFTLTAVENISLVERSTISHQILQVAPFGASNIVRLNYEISAIITSHHS